MSFFRVTATSLQKYYSKEYIFLLDKAVFNKDYSFLAKKKQLRSKASIIALNYNKYT